MSPWGVDEFGYQKPMPTNAVGEPGAGTIQSVLENAAQAARAGRVTPFKLGNVEFVAHGDRCIIMEDEFKSGYECEFCGGKGKVKCDGCSGTGVSPINPEIRCKVCEGNLIVTCPQCEGKGGTLIVPDNAQRRPTTGTIMSIGPGLYQNGVWVATHFKVGDSVMYSNFAGYALDIDNKVVRVLHEVEIFCLVRGHLTLRGNVKGAREMPDSHDSFNASMLDRGRS